MPNKPAYAVYTYNGSRGTPLLTTKYGKNINYVLRKGSVFGVKPSAKGFRWASITIDKLSPSIIFDVPVNTVSSILRQSILYKPKAEAQKQAPDMHLLQLAQVWQKASPKGLGKLAVQPWYVLAKWANIHQGIRVKPADLYLATEYVEKGFDETKKGLLKDLKPYLMQVHRGLYAMMKLFKTRLTRKNVTELAAYIKNPRSGTATAKALMRAHDERWKPNKTNTGYIK